MLELVNATKKFVGEPMVTTALNNISEVRLNELRRGRMGFVGATLQASGT